MVYVNKAKKTLEPIVKGFTDCPDKSIACYTEWKGRYFVEFMTQEAIAIKVELELVDVLKEDTVKDYAIKTCQATDEQDADIKVVREICTPKWPGLEKLCFDATSNKYDRAKAELVSVSFANKCRKVDD